MITGREFVNQLMGEGGGGGGRTKIKIATLWKKICDWGIWGYIKGNFLKKK